ncbi:NAD-dependent epimerase/dehydratase family protein [Heliobacterium undosum]|uniref:NAD-dependent epimerase/dehydratase family protein n=1 Tax=Heliomicrobium undosum TaxID=121734 RepID=A0A845KYV2_9FIRM|nr:UDP-glucuronic acid decarboxylase family protein [Heliomicrobium undosum]MZP28783.1 NAD-dependent epimerase/dehydratase family protein [Heliomicrobium undosum]
MGNLRRKRILVAGGAGFIGSHLCDALIRDGHDVICLDNYYTGRKENVYHLLNHPRFSLVEHDVELPLELDAEEIYDLACPASPVHYSRRPIQTLRTNVLGALNLLELANRKQAKILLASTSEVYGDPEVHPQREDYLGNVNPIGRRACYDEGKRCAETLFFDYRREKGVNIRVVRIFNTYGPRMNNDDGRVISNLIVQALAGGDMTIYGDGSQTRSFCYIDDLIEGMVRMMNGADDFPGPVNLGNPAETTILELASQVRALTGSASRFVFQPRPEDDPKRRRPDIKLAKERLNWTPKTSLDEGLRSTIEFFRSQHVKEEYGKITR